MTSVMDSSSLMDDGRNINRMSNLMGHDMSSQMGRNLMGMDQQRYSNMMVKDSIDRKMMGQENMGHNMIGQDNTGRNMMGRNIYNIMSNSGMPSDISGMMGKQLMDSSMMDQQDMTVNVMGR